MGDEGEGSPGVTDVEIQGAGAAPSQGLFQVEEFFGVPAFGEFGGELSDSVRVVGGDEGVIGVVWRVFSVALDKEIKGTLGAWGVVGETSGGISSPVALELSFGDLLDLL